MLGYCSQRARSEGQEQLHPCSLPVSAARWHKTEAGSSIPGCLVVSIPQCPPERRPSTHSRRLSNANGGGPLSCISGGDTCSSQTRPTYGRPQGLVATHTFCKGWCVRLPSSHFQAQSDKTAVLATGAHTCICLDPQKVGETCPPLAAVQVVCMPLDYRLWSKWCQAHWLALSACVSPPGLSRDCQAFEP